MDDARPAASRPICFLSDFGLRDDFVGLCKGVILSLSPDAAVIDLTHYVPGFGVESGAETLAHAARYMPQDTVYLAVVDPGVGTERRGLALATRSGGHLVGPDNGLLLPAADSLGGVARAVSLTNPEYHLTPVSPTFHGRDVFAPAAARLSAGLDPGLLGDEVDPQTLVRVEPAGVVHEDEDTFVATIVDIDRYGNARLSVGDEEAGFEFGAPLEVEVDDGGAMPARYVRTFGSSRAGDLVVVLDSRRRLALAINRGNAARALSLALGGRVRLSPAGGTGPARP
jgi:S-adenosylmethionine hydrolase